jgi:hypothetical protein
MRELKLQLNKLFSLSWITLLRLRDSEVKVTTRIAWVVQGLEIAIDI